MPAVLAQTKKWEILGTESSHDQRSELFYHHQRYSSLIYRGATILFRLPFLFQSMTTFLQISFAQVLWQFLPRRAMRQFQVFLWRQILLAQRVELQYSRPVGHLLR